MEKIFFKKIVFCFFIFTAGCSRLNILTENPPPAQTLTVTPTIQHSSSMTPSQTITDITKLEPDNPTPNENFLIINQRSYYLSTLSASESTLLFTDQDSPIEMANLSQDKTKFAYFRNNYIYIEDIETQKTITLNKEIIGSLGGNLRWSSDGKKLFMSCSYERQPSMAVCVIDTSNGQIDVLINEKNTDEICHTTQLIGIQFQDISADESKIIYSCVILSAQGTRPQFAIYIYDTVSKTSIKVLDSQSQNTIWYFINVLLSPDNNSLLINSGNQNHIINVFLMDLKTGAIKQLTNDPAYNFQATAWGSDGKSFYAHKGSNSQPYTEENLLIDINGTILSTVNIQGMITR